MIVLTCTCTLSFGTYITGALAMNLNNAILLTPNYGPFFIAAVGTGAFAIFGGLGFIHYLKMKGLVPFEAPYRERAQQRNSEDVTASPMVSESRTEVSVQVMSRPPSALSVSLPSATI